MSGARATVRVKEVYDATRARENRMMGEGRIENGTGGREICVPTLRIYLNSPPPTVPLQEPQVGSGVSVEDKGDGEHHNFAARIQT